MCLAVYYMMQMYPRVFYLTLLLRQTAIQDNKVNKTTNSYLINEWATLQVIDKILNSNIFHFPKYIVSTTFLRLPLGAHFSTMSVDRYMASIIVTAANVCSQVTTSFGKRS